jgi:hypothetical protein
MNSSERSQQINQSKPFIGHTNMQSLENQPHLSTTPLQDQTYTDQHAPNEHQTP